MKLKQKNLLFKNLIRQNFKNWVQLIVMSFLLLISSLFFMLVLFSNTTLNNARNETNRISNLHDFVIDFNNAQNIGNNNISYNSENYYENALESAANLKNNNFNNQFIWDRVETRNLYFDRGNENSTFLKVVTDNQNARIDKLIISDGYNIGKNPNITVPITNQIVVEKKFAIEHNINIGAIIRLQSDNLGSNIKISDSGQSIPNGYNWFKVVGYGFSADYEAPIFTNQTVMPNKMNQFLVYVDPSQFGLTSNLTQFNNNDRYWNYLKNNDKWASLSSADTEIYYVAKFINNSEKNVNLVSDYLSHSKNDKLFSSDTVNLLNNYSDIIINNINNSNFQAKLKNDLKSQDINNEQNIKNDLINEINKTTNLNWDNRWNINLFLINDNSQKTSFDYYNYINDDVNYKELYVEIIQSPLQGENNIYNFSFKINNPLYQNYLSFNLNNSINDIAKKLVDDATKATFLQKIESNLLSVGNGDNYKNIKKQIINLIIENNRNNYSSIILDDIKKYLDDKLSYQLISADLDTTKDLNNQGQLTLLLDNNKEETINTNIILNNNDFSYFKDSKNPYNKFAYALGDKSYVFNSRTNELNTGVHIFNLFMGIMLLITLLISSIVLFLIIKKSVYYMKKQLGVLKAIGYSNSLLIGSFLSLPTVLTIFCVALAYPLALISQVILKHMMENYFNLIFTPLNLEYSLIVFAICVVSLFLFLIIISFFSCWISVSKPLTEMLYNSQKVSTSKFVEILKKPYKNRKFKIRFEISMLSQSLDKLVILSSTLLIVILLLSSAVIFPNIMYDNKKYATIDDKYNNLVQYQTPIYNSPYSFLKTYNPVATDDIPSNLNAIKNYVSAFANKNESTLSSNYYALDPKMNSVFLGQNLINLDNRIFTKDFLNQLDWNDADSSLDDICKTIWTDYSQISNIWKNYDSIYTNDKQLIYDTYREFYAKYQNTISLTINPRYIDHNNPNQNTDPAYIDFSKLGNDISNTKIQISDFKIVNNKVQENSLDKQLHIYNDQDFLTYDYAYMHLNKKDDEIKNYIQDFNTLFAAVYFGRVSQAIIQEMYSISPFEVQNQMKSKLDKDQNFNLSFNVVPYNPITDELGLMFNAQSSETHFNVLGVNNNSKLLNLKNLKNKYIQNLISNPTSNSDGSYNLIINESLEKKLGWKLNSIYSLNTFINQLEYNNNLISIKANDNQKYAYNSSDIFTNTGDIRNNNYSNLIFNALDDKNKYLYKSGLNMSTDDYTSYPTIDQQLVQNGNIALNTNLKNIKVKVVAIDRSYGQPTAYINNENALNIMQYNQSREFLFKMFQNEWSEVNYNGDLNIDFKQLNNYKSYEELLNDESNNAQLLLTMFKNEYPIFNYKMSNDSSVYDFTSSLSLSNLYGDFSKLALQGGLGYIDTKPDDGMIQWNSYGSSSLSSLSTIFGQKQALNEIDDKIDIILVFFTALAIIMALIIIIIVSDVIFNENKIPIITMKILGYNSFEVVKSIFGFYIILAIIIFLISLPVTFFTIKGFLSLASIAIPVFFSWTMPVILFVILSAIFFLIFYVNFKAIKDTSIIR